MKSSTCARVAHPLWLHPIHSCQPSPSRDKRFCPPSGSQGHYCPIGVGSLRHLSVYATLFAAFHECGHEALMQVRCQTRSVGSFISPETVFGVRRSPAGDTDRPRNGGRIFNVVITLRRDDDHSERSMRRAILYSELTVSATTGTLRNVGG